MITRTVDEQTCNPLRLWHDLGEPSSLSEEEKKLLRDGARPFVSSGRLEAKGGKLRLALAVREFGVVSFELRPVRFKGDRGYDYKRVMGE